MKKMNNYEAPKAEMIELNANLAFMQTGGEGTGFASGGDDEEL